MKGYFDMDIEWDIEKPMGDMKRLMSTKRKAKVMDSTLK